MTGGRPAFPPPPRRDAVEYELLLACLRARFAPSAEDRVADLAALADADQFAGIVDRHRLSGLVDAALRDAGVRGTRLSDAVAASAGHVAIRALRQTTGLARVVDLLRAESIEPLALKGPVMAFVLYGDVGLRPSGDLDLLIRQEDLRAAREVLLRAGFTADPPLSDAEADAYFEAGFAYSFHDAASAVEVELHPALAHRAFAFAPEMAGVWQRAQVADVAGRGILRLSDEDRILFLCMHGAKHEWDQLIWVCDVAEALRVAPDIDWATVIRRAERSGSLRMLQLGLHLAHHLTGVTLPVESAVLAAHPALPRLANQVWRRMQDSIETRPGLWRSLRFHVGVRERPAERRAQIREKTVDATRDALQSARIWLTPSETDRAFVSLPVPLAPLYFVVRPIRVLLGLVSRGREEAVSHERATSDRPLANGMARTSRA